MRASDRDGAQAQEQARVQAARIEQLQQRMMRLEMENRELRRQLDELRRGVGIAVLIQGRPVALSALPPVPVGPTQSTGMPATPVPSMPPVPPVAPMSGATGQHPALTPNLRPASFAPGAMPTPAPAPFVAGPRSRVPNNGPRSYAPESGPLSLFPDYGSRTGPVPDDHWLTGRRPAVQPPHRPYPTPAPQPRPQSPSQWVTPDWLREPSPAPPMPAAPAAPPAPPAQPIRRGTTGQHPSLQQPTRARSTNAARPLRPHFEPADVPSLAQLTGRQAAVRRGSKRTEDERSPFADSFVLD